MGKQLDSVLSVQVTDYVRPAPDKHRSENELLQGMHIKVSDYFADGVAILEISIVTDITTSINPHPALVLPKLSCLHQTFEISNIPTEFLNIRERKFSILHGQQGPTGQHKLGKLHITLVCV